jgi:hypothetical protein
LLAAALDFDIFVDAEQIFTPESVSVLVSRHQSACRLPKHSHLVALSQRTAECRWLIFEKATTVEVVYALVHNASILPN